MVTYHVGVYCRVCVGQEMALLVDSGAKLVLWVCCRKVCKCSQAVVVGRNVYECKFGGK